MADSVNPSLLAVPHGATVAAESADSLIGTSAGALPVSPPGSAPRRWVNRQRVFTLDALSRTHLSLIARASLLIGVELSLLLLWTLSVTRPYLNLDPHVSPMGREYFSTINLHFLWDEAKQCGWCATWNGTLGGGMPAFADTYGSQLHPLVAVTTLIWGVVNGAKLTLVGAFFMAGLAQWWLGRVLGVGRVARLWSAGMAVVAGNLAGRMEDGALAMVVSTAACALVLPPLLSLARSSDRQAGGRRAAILLGVTLAMAAVSGQSYMQIGLVLGLPLTLLLVPMRYQTLTRFFRGLALAGGLAFLLASPYLIPLFHFLSQFAKATDPAFLSAQPFPFVPLNLVVNDLKFYLSDSLQKLPFPVVYVNYIGWIAVLLAFWGLRGHRSDFERRAAVFLAGFVVFMLWFSSAAPLIWMAHTFRGSFLAQQATSLRFPGMIAGLAIPALLGLAALALDRLITRHWPSLRVSLGTGTHTSRVLVLNSAFLLIVPLSYALTDARTFGGTWIKVVPDSPEVSKVIDAVRPPDLQWVDLPFGEHFWAVYAAEGGIKWASNTLERQQWKGRTAPEPSRVADRNAYAKDGTPIGVVSGIYLTQMPEGREYAVVKAADGSAERIVCSARGLGGDIDVQCQNAHAGTLTVEENSWTGWQATIDGVPAQIKPGRWLTADVPAGTHTVSFRYRPWDVSLGVVLCLVGLAASIYLWLKPQTVE